MTKSELQRLIKKLGGVRAAANNLGVSTQAVYQWLADQRPVPPQKAAQLRTLVSMAGAA